MAGEGILVSLAQCNPSEMVIEPNSDEMLLLTPDDVAKWLQVPRKWVIEHTTRYEPIIPHRRFGRKLRFTKADVQSFVDSQLRTVASWDTPATS